MEIIKKTRAFFSLQLSTSDAKKSQKVYPVVNSIDIFFSWLYCLEQWNIAIFPFQLPVNLLLKDNSCHFFKLIDIRKTKG